MAEATEVHRWEGHCGPVKRLAFTADGKRLISASADTSALVWDVAAVTGKLDSR